MMLSIIYLYALVHGHRDRGIGRDDMEHGRWTMDAGRWLGTSIQYAKQSPLQLQAPFDFSEKTACRLGGRG